MDKLTPEAVAKHAAAHPLPIKLAPNHIEGFVVEGLPLGQWRYMGDDPQSFPMFFAVALDGTAIRAMCMEGRYEMDLTNCPLGTWTPVLPDGSDLPDDRAQDREDLSEATRKAGEQAIRLAALEEGWHGGCAGWIRRLEQECEDWRVIAREATRQHRVMIEREKAESLARQAESPARAALGKTILLAVEEVVGPVPAMEPGETPNDYAGRVAQWVQSLTGAAHDRGRADERAAIVAGLTARVEDMEGSLTPLTQPESRRNLESQANELSNIIVFLKTGEWSAKP